MTKAKAKRGRGRPRGTMFAAWLSGSITAQQEAGLRRVCKEQARDRSEVLREALTAYLATYKGAP